MEEIAKYAFETGALNQVILAVIALGSAWFLFMSWWPEHVERNKRRDEADKLIKLKEIETEKEIKMIEIKGQIEVYKDVVTNIKSMQTKVESMSAMFNDFLQNVLSQFIEDRRDLIDSQIFKNKDRP